MFLLQQRGRANETAIKLARLNGAAEKRYKIITFLDSFHGRTMGALSATGQPKYHAGVEPMLAGFRHAPFGDLKAVAQLIDNETIAIMVEPIQGEGGVNLPPAGFLEGLRELCDKHKLLLIFDEVQSGMGRTGKWYAYQNWSVCPDMITLAKAAAGGVALGGLVAKPEVAEKLKPGTHAATFGGNPIACVAGLATIETIEADGLLERAAVLERKFRERFEALKSGCPILREVRAKGVMVGLELSVPGADIVKRCLERKLLINCTHNTVIRLLPALNLPDALFDEGCDILEEALTSKQ